MYLAGTVNGFTLLLFKDPSYTFKLKQCRCYKVEEKLAKIMEKRATR